MPIFFKDGKHEDEYDDGNNDGRGYDYARPLVNRAFYPGLFAFSCVRMTMVMVVRRLFFSQFRNGKIFQKLAEPHDKRHFRRRKQITVIVTARMSVQRYSAPAKNFQRDTSEYRNGDEKTRTYPFLLEKFFESVDNKRTAAN